MGLCVDGVEGLPAHEQRHRADEDRQVTHHPAGHPDDAEHHGGRGLGFLGLDRVRRRMRGRVVGSVVRLWWVRHAPSLPHLRRAIFGRISLRNRRFDPRVSPND